MGLALGIALGIPFGKGIDWAAYWADQGILFAPDSISLISNGATDYILLGYTFPNLLGTDTVEVEVIGPELWPDTDLDSITGSYNNTAGHAETFINLGRGSAATSEKLRCIFNANNSATVVVSGAANPVINNSVRVDYNKAHAGNLTIFVDDVEYATGAIASLATVVEANIVDVALYCNTQNAVAPPVNPSVIQISEYIVKINDTEVIHLVAQSDGYFYDTVRDINIYNRDEIANTYPLGVIGDNEVVITKQVGRYLAFPSACRVGDRIIVAYKNGTVHYGDDADARLVCKYTDDDLAITDPASVTWSDEVVIAAAVDVRATANWQNIWITGIRNRIVAFYADFITNGQDAYTWCKYSDDGGETWSAPYLVTSTFGSFNIQPHSKILVRPDGKWIVGCRGCTSDVYPQRIILLQSSNEGATWTDLSYLDTGEDMSEIGMIYNDIGDIIIRQGISTSDNVYISHDDGATIELYYEDFICSNPVYINKYGVLYLLARGQSAGTILSKLYLYKSVDNGATFTFQEVVDSYEGLVIQGGYGDLVEINNITLMCVYYTTKGSETFIAYKLSNNT